MCWKTARRLHEIKDEFDVVEFMQKTPSFLYTKEIENWKKLEKN